MNAAPFDQPEPSPRMFHPDGTVRRFPGNVVLCRIGSGNTAFGTIASIQSALQQESFARKFAFMPAAGLHMTVFDGAQAERRHDGYWPADMSDEGLGAVNARFAEKLADLDVPAGFRMKPTAVTLDPQRGSVIRLVPGDHGERRRLDVLRERLAERLEIHVDDHPKYEFHVTMSYLLAPLDTGEEQAVRKAHGALTVHLGRALSMLEVGAPEFCTFENVFYYERRMYLGEPAR